MRVGRDELLQWETIKTNHHSLSGLILSTMEEKREQFRDYVKASNERNLIIGQGSPLADILLIGCEPNGTKERYEELKKHIEACLNNENNMTFEKLWGHPYPNKKGQSGGWTWNKYQKLIDRVYPDRSHNGIEKGVLDFEEMAFCTELNNVFASHSADADKSTIPQKLQLFKKSSFIQSFPVVILACGPDYIVNRGDKLQINETFGVMCTEEVQVIKDATTRPQRYWVHYDNMQEPHKLVIHTRQLSGRSRPCDELLWSIGRIVRMFLSSIGKLK